MRWKTKKASLHKTSFISKGKYFPVLRRLHEQTFYVMLLLVLGSVLN